MRLAEIAEVLARHGGMRASVELENTGRFTISVAVHDDMSEGEALELQETLRRLNDLETIRLFAHRYGVPPEKLEAFLTERFSTGDK